MKQNKTISLDVALIKQLQAEDNASGLISSLLMKHYQLAKASEMTREDRIAYLTKLKAIKLKEKEIEDARRELKQY